MKGPHKYLSLSKMINKLINKTYPQTNGRIYLNSLNNQVSISRNEWGIPTITAKNRTDLFFGQGFVHAQDRLWQMELNRRAAHGTLSELFGRLTLQSDRLSRTLGFGQLAKATWQLLDKTARSDVIAYAAGVNAYLSSHPTRPLEFVLLAHRADPWHPLDTLVFGRLQMWALTTGASSELIYAQLIEQLGSEMAAELSLSYPPTNPITLPDGIEVTRLQLDKMMHSSAAPFLGKGSANGEGRGSNGWVIAANRSQTGAPILANDLHLPLSNPSYWHLQHLQSDDGIQAAGFSQPGLPYIMVGHNDDIAWGATMAYTDSEDLFYEEFDALQPNRYRSDGRWLQANQRLEKINIRGGSTHTEVVTSTHHGPIVSPTLYQRPSGVSHQLSLASTALKPDLVMSGFGSLMTAKNWSDFVTAVSKIQAPPLNILFADKGGSIGHYLSGQVPIRAKGDGKTPRPGLESSWDWQGIIPFSEMPHALNPKHGVIISANNKIINQSYPHYLGDVWRNGFRARRIAHLIGNKPLVSLQDCQIMQQDVHHLPAEIICQHLRKLNISQPDAQFCQKKLIDWDYKMKPDSVAATIFQIFLTHLTRKILLPKLSIKSMASLLGSGSNSHFAPLNDFQGQWLLSIIKLLDNPHTKWYDYAKKDELLVDCLKETAVTLNISRGVNTFYWRWGNHHRTTLKHALGERWPFNRLFNVKSIPIGGDNYTVQQNGMLPTTALAYDYQNNGISVSARMVVDCRNWDNFFVGHIPGQSGHIGHKNNRDLIDNWQKGALIRLEWQSVKGKSRERTVFLLPQNQLNTKPLRK